jgi:hypothetical protein
LGYSAQVAGGGERRRGVVSHEYPLEMAPEALRFSYEHYDEAIKVVLVPGLEELIDHMIWG